MYSKYISIFNRFTWIKLSEWFYIYNFFCIFTINIKPISIFRATIKTKLRFVTCTKTTSFGKQWVWTSRIALEIVSVAELIDWRLVQSIFWTTLLNVANFQIMPERNWVRSELSHLYFISENVSYLVEMLLQFDVKYIGAWSFHS